MITSILILSIFIILLFLEVGYLWFQWDKISIAVDISNGIVNLTGQKEKVDAIISIVLSVLSKFKGLLWIPAILLLFINIVFSLVLGFILSGIHSLILLCI